MSPSFNPRARMGRDVSRRHQKDGNLRFNPRARMGRDNTVLALIVGYFCFNPRARMGRDSVNLQQVHDVLVSTHAPAWGATIADLQKSFDDQFQPTRPHGARLN